MLSSWLIRAVRTSGTFSAGVLAIMFATPATGEEARRPVVLKNPYAEVNWEAVNHYLANFHCHTVYSDGTAEPELLINNYAEAGYSILAIADHDNYHTTRPGEREIPPTHETTWPWTRWIPEEPSRVWTRDGMESSAFFPGLGEHGMLAIRGNELSGHPQIVSLFNDSGFADTTVPCDERLATVAERGGIAYWAHPSIYVPPHVWGDLVFDESIEEAIAYDADHIARHDALIGVEFNQDDVGARRNEAVAIYDGVLRAALRDHDVFIFASDDSHRQDVAENAALTIVLAEELTEESVRHALENGHTFVGQRSTAYPELRGVTVDEEALTIEVSTAEPHTINWFKDGEHIAQGPVISYADMRDAVLRFEMWSANVRFYSQGFYIE